MKRIVALVIALVFVLSGVSFADSLVDRLPVAWKTVTFNNTSGMYAEHSFPTTLIVPGVDVILGFVVIPLGGLNADSSATLTSEAVVALYDATDTNTTSVATDEVFDEAEAGVSSSLPRWYEYPRKIQTQLTVRIGPNTGVVIYYE